MTSEPFGGQKMAQIGLANKSVPPAQLRDEAKALADKLLEKNPAVLRNAKNGFKRCRELDWDQKEDYLYAKLDQCNGRDPEQGRMSSSVSSHSSADFTTSRQTESPWQRQLTSRAISRWPSSVLPCPMA